MKPIFKALSTVAILLATSAASATSILYDFETDAQGWTVAGDANSSLGLPSIAPTWARGSSLPGTVGQVLPSIWWTNPNNGGLGVERSHVTSPILIAEGMSVMINFDSYSSNEGGYPTFYDVEHIQLSINGGAFFDLHGNDPDLHLFGDQTFRNISYTDSSNVSAGDQLQFRFLYDTGDGCCGPTNISGWAFDNVYIDLDYAVPEPTTLALFGLGLAGLGFARRKKA